jgi:hypothetical protein
LGEWERTEAETGSAEANDGKGFRRTSGGCSLTSLLWALALTGEAIRSVPATTKKASPSSPPSGPRTGRRPGEHDEAELRWKMGDQSAKPARQDALFFAMAGTLSLLEAGGVPRPDTTPWFSVPMSLMADAGEGILLCSWMAPPDTNRARVGLVAEAA